MSAVSTYFRSTIGQKQIMGITGLMWCGFVLMHMLGNLLLFVGPEAYNKYSHAIVSNPAIFLAEGLLVLTLIAHALRGVAVTARNRAARPVTPAVGLSGDKATSFAVKTMIFQGMLILIFVITHLLTFKFGTHYTVNYNGVEMRDIHKLVVEVFKQPLYQVWYFVALVALGLHLSHGFYSSIQTLGIHHPSYNPKLKCLGHIYAIITAAGFIAQPLYVFFFAS